jgi:F-type H+-transporting ATPase subunit b
VLIGFDAWGSEDGGHGGESWSKFGFKVANFVILIALLYWLLAKLARNFFASRKESIRQALEEAKNNKEEAERRYKEFSGKLASLEEKAKEIAKDLREEGEKEKEIIINEAREVAKKILEQAEVTASHEIKKAIQELREEATNLIISLAEETIKKEISGEDQERLIKDYVDKLSGFEGTIV